MQDVQKIANRLGSLEAAWAKTNKAKKLNPNTKYEGNKNQTEHHLLSMANAELHRLCLLGTLAEEAFGLIQGLPFQCCWQLWKTSGVNSKNTWHNHFILTICLDAVAQHAPTAYMKIGHTPCERMPGTFTLVVLIKNKINMSALDLAQS